MTQYQNSELIYLFNSLSLHRANYVKLLTQGSNGEEITHCEKAIQFYLSAISMVASVPKRSKHFTFSFKSMFSRVTSLMKPKLNPQSLQAI